MAARSRSANGAGIVLYDFLYCNGGAETVALELARNLPEAGLCFGFLDQRQFPPDLLRGIRSFDLGIRARSAAGRTLAGLTAFRRRTAFMRDYGWAIYSGFLAPQAVFNHRRGLNLYYCHTPPRFVYDLNRYYLERLPVWQRPAFQMLAAYVRHRYESALALMDRCIANSETVRRRMQQYLGLDATVIHPPCDTIGFRWWGAGSYYLSTARLEPYKRVDLIIEAFLEQPAKQLVVTSGGSDERRLRVLAGDAANIRFTGWVDQPTLRRLVGESIATLYLALDEDFGMSPVESMAAGKPVIGTAEGGLLETVVDGRTGLLLAPDPTPEHVVDAVQRLDARRAEAMRSDCERQARRFMRASFLEQMRAELNCTRTALPQR